MPQIELEKKAPDRQRRFQVQTLTKEIFRNKIFFAGFEMLVILHHIKISRPILVSV